MIVSLIAAVDAQNGIGKNNHLLCSIAEDMERFKMLTAGRTIIMGSSTFASIGAPLPHRTNIVLSRSPMVTNGVVAAKSLEDALSKCSGSSEVFVIGGGTVFSAATNAANRIYLTRMYEYFDADTFFPTIDMSQWQTIEYQHFNYGKNYPKPFDFIVYEKNTKISTI